jgi:sugar transferase (PEP-CTERM/EpsH1 system associated)
MKILWVKGGGLVPPDSGGKIRSYHILRELAKRHSVTFFSYYAEHPSDIHEQLTQLFERAVYIPLRIPIPRSRGEICHFARHMWSPLPYSVAKHSQTTVVSALRNLLQESSYDVVISDFVIPGAVIPGDIGCPKIIFTHNVEAQIWHRQFKTAFNPIWKVVAWSEYRKMLRYERLCLENADHVFTVSENDRSMFARFIDRQHITVIPTGVDTEYFRPAGDGGQANKLVFTGAMDWMPNEDAIVYFAGEILPLIRQEIPQVTLTVAGRGPSRRLLALAVANKCIRVTGRVTDIRPYMAEGSVFVVPLRIGGGTRLKIFEAMAMGKAIVSTSIGAEGLPVIHGKDIVMADTPRNFARSVIDLLRRPEQRKNLGLSARQRVEEQHSWNAVSHVFDSALGKVVRGYRDNVNVNMSLITSGTRLGVS